MLWSFMSCKAFFEAEEIGWFPVSVSHFFFSKKNLNISADTLSISYKTPFLNTLCRSGYVQRTTSVLMQEQSCVWCVRVLAKRGTSLFLPPPPSCPLECEWNGWRWIAGCHLGLEA